MNGLFQAYILTREYLKYTPIRFPSSVKHIETQILVIAESNGIKYFILRDFAVFDIIRPSKEFPIQS